MRIFLEKLAKLFANSGDPDQMLHYAASDLDLYCLPITLLCLSRLQWLKTSLGGSARPTGDQEVGFDLCRGRQHSFLEINHEIFSTAILSFPLIQEGQLSVSGRRMCTILVNRLED